MYHQQALDSSAQTTTLNAQMPRQFVRGYDRQAVSRIQGGGYTPTGKRLPVFQKIADRGDFISRMRKFHTSYSDYPASDWDTFFQGGLHKLPEGGRPPLFPKGQRPTFIYNDKKK